MSTPEPTDRLFKAVICYIRTHYEEKRGGRHVPNYLRRMILEFSKRVIGCDLLTLAEDLKLVSKLKDKILGFDDKTKFIKLFKASEHAFRAKKFHKYVDGNPDTITIIKSNWGSRFGGYASKPFLDNDTGIILDPAAFVFAIDAAKDAQIFDKARHYPQGHKEQNCFRYEPELGPCFGNGDIEITDRCDRKADLNNVPSATSYCRGFTFNTDLEVGKGRIVRLILCGEPAEGGYRGGFGEEKLWQVSVHEEGALVFWNWFEVEEYEVFRIKLRK